MAAKRSKTQRASPPATVPPTAPTDISTQGA